MQVVITLTPASLSCLSAATVSASVGDFGISSTRSEPSSLVATVSPLARALPGPPSHCERVNDAAAWMKPTLMLDLQSPEPVPQRFAYGHVEVPASMPAAALAIPSRADSV